LIPDVPILLHIGGLYPCRCDCVDILLAKNWFTSKSKIEEVNLTSGSSPLHFKIDVPKFVEELNTPLKFELLAEVSDPESRKNTSEVDFTVQTTAAESETQELAKGNR
jgi:hypothetical protein